MKRIRLLLVLLLLIVPFILSSCCKKSRFTDIQENIYNSYTENQHFTYTINDTDTLEMYVEHKSRWLHHSYFGMCIDEAHIGLITIDSIKQEIHLTISNLENSITAEFKDFYISIYEDNLKTYRNNESYYINLGKDTAIFVKNKGLIKISSGDSLVINLINQ